jgi:tartrate-resistant acid phosphatase type 5
MIRFSWRRSVRSGEQSPGVSLWRFVTLILLMILLVQACRHELPSTTQPITSRASPFPTIVDPLASPQPADQSAVMLAGTPAIPANLTLYTIRLNIDYPEHTFTGYTRIDYTNTETEALESLFFRSYPNLGQSYGNGQLIVYPAIINGQPAETKMSLNGSVVEVHLPSALAPGEKVQVNFESKGFVPVDFGSGDSASGYGMYNYSQGVLALANFYPQLAVYESGEWRLDPIYGYGDSVYSDAALYTVEVFSDPSLVLATSGMWVSQQAVDGKVMRRYISGPARDFFIIASPDYQVASRQVGETIVNSYYLPEDNAGGEQALETAARSLEIFIKRYGPYPYKEYDIVEAPLNQPSGIEYPALGLINERLYDDLVAPDFNATVAHEVAHQWWYNVVGNDVQRAPWMDEALATYSSILYWEQVGGAPAKQQALAYYQAKYDQNTQTGWDAPVTSPMAYFQESNRIESYNPIVYAKGGLFYDELRRTVGDDAFFRALQFYYGTHWFTIASTSELLGALQSATSIKLDDLFETWLYMPEVAIPMATSTSTPVGTPTPTQTLEPTETATPEPTSTPALRPLVFAVIGDYGGADEETGEVAELIESWQPEFIITVGDNNYPFGAANHIDDAIGQFFHQYIYNYQGKYGEGADINRFYPVLGNHDTLSADGQPYFDYFTLPGNERYYDFEWGPVHMYALDMLDTEPDGFRASSIQADWLQESLATSTSTWNIVYGHYPPYSSGLHGSTEWARWPFSEWGVDAVFSGHDHNYERLFEDGVTYFVNGAGGYSLYDFKHILQGSQVRYNDDYGAIRVEATDEYLLFQFINRKNEIVDQVELRK